MSAAQHTPGRLFTLPKYPDTIHAETPGGRGLRVGEASSFRMKAEDYANARRLVACWNACQNIETDTLEKFTLGVVSAENSRVTIERTRQRDDLLAALKRIEGASMLMYATRSDMLDYCQDIAHAAIQKAEGK